MKALKIILIIVIILSVTWHVAENSTTRRISGIFQFSPRKGSVWADTYDKRSKFFWQHSVTISWSPGRQIHGYNVNMSTIEDEWDANPGYVIVDKTARTTRWQPGMLHPVLKAYARKTEGTWAALFGYELTREEGSISYFTYWVPGQKNEYLKLISGKDEGVYIAYPGYAFVDQSSLQVKWTPGLFHPDSPNYISATNEGTWDIKSEPTKSRTSTELSHAQKWLVAGFAGKTLESIFGKFFLSKALMDESDKQFVEIFTDK